MNRPQVPTSRFDDGEELFPLVTEQGEVVGSATRKACHDGSMQLHPVVHLHLFNSQGELYLQHRPAWKDIQPNRWDTAVGGHVSFGESIPDALRREVREELGITDFEPEHLATYPYRSDREYELIHAYRTCYDGAIVPSDELDGGRFWSLSEIESNLGRGLFTPNFEQEFLRIFQQ